MMRCKCFGIVTNPVLVNYKRKNGKIVRLPFWFAWNFLYGKKDRETIRNWLENN